MTRVPEPPNPECSEKLAQLLHTALLTAHQQQADLLTETCQTWLQATTPEMQQAKLVLKLSPTVPEQLQAVERMLAKLFIPAFRGTQPLLPDFAAIAGVNDPKGRLRCADPGQPPPWAVQPGLGRAFAGGCRKHSPPPKTLEAFLKTVLDSGGLLHPHSPRVHERRAKAHR